MKTPKWLTSASLALVMLSGLYAEPHCPGNVASIRPRFVERSILIRSGDIEQFRSLRLCSGYRGAADDH